MIDLRNSNYVPGIENYSNVIEYNSSNFNFQRPLDVTRRTGTIDGAKSIAIVLCGPSN